MSDVERAISEISDIRSQLAASTRFRGYAPEAVAVIGFVSLLIMLAQIIWPERFAADNRQQVLIWGVMLLASGLTMAIEAISRSRSQHGGMAGAMLKGALRTSLPITFVGFAIAVVVLGWAPETAWILPGIWQMLVGLVAFSSFSIMPRAIVWPALWYVFSGTTVMVLAGQAGELTPLMSGGPFIVGHLSIAWILYREGASSQ